MYYINICHKMHDIQVKYMSCKIYHIKYNLKI